MDRLRVINWKGGLVIQGQRSGYSTHDGVGSRRGLESSQNEMYLSTGKSLPYINQFWSSLIEFCEWFWVYAVVEWGVNVEFWEGLWGNCQGQDLFVNPPLTTSTVTYVLLNFISPPRTSDPRSSIVTDNRVRDLSLVLVVRVCRTPCTRGVASPLSTATHPQEPGNVVMLLSSHGRTRQE